MILISIPLVLLKRKNFIVLVSDLYIICFRVGLSSSRKILPEALPVLVSGEAETSKWNLG